MGKNCSVCGHHESSHDPKCGALDAAGDVCDCTGAPVAKSERVEQVLSTQKVVRQAEGQLILPGYAYRLDPRFTEGATVKIIAVLDTTGERCTHDRLNEDGICRSCGADRRGI